MSDRHWLCQKKEVSNLQLIHSHHFSSTSCWAFPPAQHVEKKTCFAISASYLWNVVLTLGRMPVTTRRIVQFLHWHGILFLLSTDLPSFSSDDFPFPSLVAFEFGAGEDVRSFCLWSSLPLPEALIPWLETTRVSFRTLSSCLPLPAISLFPFNVGFIILSTPCHYSSMNHIVSGFEVPTSHLLVKKQSHWCF